VIEIHPLAGMGETRPGADLAAELAAALRRMGVAPSSGDLLVVTQKIISKAENRFVNLASVRPGAEAERLAAITDKDPRLVEVVLAESTAVLRAVPGVLITRHRCGWVMANAGVDRSNLGPDREDQVLLLPVDADASAQRLRRALSRLCEADLAVVISDSFGRPWRNGVVNVALGCAGAPALVDRRGDLDRDGRPLNVTQIAVADMIATAAGLAMGEAAEGFPAALVRGLSFGAAPAEPASVLNRPLERDLFQ
jgi:coenzyme F420-0:L-glutamate ligase / coenzyme F420-1:gamma-L-glutamate ligase